MPPRTLSSSPLAGRRFGAGRGETQRVSVTLDGRAFSYYDVAGKRWRAEPGEFDVYVGRSSAQIELRDKLVLPARGMAAGR